MKNPEGYSTSRVLKDWFEHETQGSRQCPNIPKGQIGDGEEVRETRQVHWCIVEGAFQREKWSVDRITILRSVMDERLRNRGFWWPDHLVPPQFSDALAIIETDVHEFYRFKRVGT